MNVSPPSLEPRPRRIGARPFQKPAFLTLEPLRAGEEPSLLVTAFGPLRPGEIRRIPEVGQHLARFASAPIETLTREATWPNQALPVDASLVGREGLVVSDGFLVPGKATGSVSFVPTDTGRPEAPVPLTAARSGWFYHRATPVDMDGDGDLDLVTARARKPLLGSPGGELLWLENPGPEKALQGPWKEHVLARGPDVHFQVVDLDRDGSPEVVACEFFTGRLSVHWSEADGWRSRVVDETMGSPFDVQLVDLDGDGHLDLLATNHQSDASAGVFAYEIPEDFRAAPWPRHTLLSGIETRLAAGKIDPEVARAVQEPPADSPEWEGNPFAASPGQAVAFHPGPAAGKPWIAVAGDGSQRAHLLIPEAGEWRYREEILADVGGTVGQLAVGDADGDGWAEIFVPAYDGDMIYGYTFAPGSNSK